MKIGIDISQMSYEGTGVSNFLKSLLAEIVSVDKDNEYILFYASLSRLQFQLPYQLQNAKNVTVKRYPFPPWALDVLWNRIHMVPIESFIGDVDVFISSDWTEPPSKNAKRATILYDLIVYKFPNETDKSIVETQRRKLAWVKKECDVILCISEATRKDAQQILGIPEQKLRVIHPGV